MPQIILPLVKGSLAAFAVVLALNSVSPRFAGNRDLNEALGGAATSKCGTSSDCGPSCGNQYDQTIKCYATDDPNNRCSNTKSPCGSNCSEKLGGGSNCGT
jgi:hypothetical protein